MEELFDLLLKHRPVFGKWEQVAETIEGASVG